ncbi:hypothetical protein GH714_001473 [Hevea brasiliensis]|uniref:peroxidase n=1 Tax=Hevea brasiliensis TaxID=3981 RepID=A0A6A6L141_HEVBR|nr:hypothetical protein GH714_001473 [Hevea brasiliensis]
MPTSDCPSAKKSGHNKAMPNMPSNELLRNLSLGCDGSVFLDDTSSMNGEKNSLSNANSLRGFDVIENVKAQVGGPSWAVKLGRRDCLTASRDLADQNLPRFTNSLSELTSSFSSKNLNQRDLAAPLGAHTLGKQNDSASVTGLTAMQVILILS